MFGDCEGFNKLAFNALVKEKNNPSIENKAEKSQRKFTDSA